MDKLYYDAFISYRHTELDSFVAQKLHKMLERYRIPKKIQEKSGKKKITRIFRDQEELPLSSDLSQNITTALQHSEYLILICSPEAMESRWVRTEIETFLQTHSRERVLTLLVKGEPEESFPEILCYKEKVIMENGEEKIVQVPVEPLAADVRGSSKEEIEKKLKNEVLRILAPMLSCSYDELRQRHREYKLKCTIGIVSVIMCFAIAFSVYAIRQAAAIEEQYQNSRKNQARYLCNISDELLKSGDRVAALQTALALQTENGTEALVPEQMYALNNALYSYHYDHAIYLNADRKLEMENAVKSLYPEYAVFFSPQGSYILTLDILGTAAFFDSITGEPIFSIDADAYFPGKKETFMTGIPVSETEAILLTEKNICVVDIVNQKLVNNFAADAEEEFGIFYNPRCGVFGEYLTAKDTDDFYIYNYVTGETVYEHERIGYEEIVDFDISPSKKQIALCVNYNDYSTEENDFYKLETYALDTGERVTWDIPAYEEMKLSYVDEEHLAVMWIPISGPDQLMETYRTYQYGVYDIQNQNMIWQDEGFGLFADYSQFFFMTENMGRDRENPENEPMMIISISNQLRVVNAMNGEVISHSEGKGNIVGVQKLDRTRLLLASENGELCVNVVSINGTLTCTTKIDAQLAAFYYHPETATGAVVRASDGKVILCRSFQDQEMSSAGAYASSIYYTSADETEYRAIDVYVNGSEEEYSILWNLFTDEEVLRVKADTNQQKLEILECLTIDEEDYVLYSLVSKEDRGEPMELHLTKIGNGEKIYQIQLNNIPSHTGEYYKDRYDVDFTVTYSKGSQMAAIYLNEQNYFEILDCRTGKIVVPFQEIVDKEIFSYTSVYAVEASADGKYFIFAGRLNETFEAEKRCYVKLWNIEEQSWEEISGKETFIIEQEGCSADEIYKENLLIGKESMQLIIYPETEEIFVVDILTGEVTQTIPFHGKKRVSLSFFDHEKYLLMYGDECHLMMWDLQQQKMTMKDTELLEHVTGIYTDESSRYFGIASNTGAIYNHIFNIYYVDEESRFYHYADIQNGFASFSAEEAFNFGSNGQSYFTKFYDYETLKAKAEEIIGEHQLTDAERTMYYLSEE